MSGTPRRVITFSGPPPTRERDESQPVALVSLDSDDEEDVGIVPGKVGGMEGVGIEPKQEIDVSVESDSSDECSIKDSSDEETFTVEREAEVKEVDDNTCDKVFGHLFQAGSTESRDLRCDSLNRNGTAELLDLDEPPVKRQKVSVFRTRLDGPIVVPVESQPTSYDYMECLKMLPDIESEDSSMDEENKELSAITVIRNEISGDEERNNLKISDVKTEEMKMSDDKEKNESCIISDVKTEEMSGDKDKNERCMILDVKTEEMSGDKDKNERCMILDVKTDEMSGDKEKNEQFTISETKTEEISGDKNEDFTILDSKTEKTSDDKEEDEHFTISDIKTVEISGDQDQNEHFKISDIKAGKSSDDKEMNENFTISDIKTEEISTAEENSNHVAIMDIKNEESNTIQENNKYVTISDIKTEEISKPEENSKHVAISDIKTEEISKPEENSKHVAISDIKTEEISTDVVISGIKNEESNNAKESNKHGTISDIKTDGMNRETAIVPVQFRNTHNLSWLYNICNKLVNHERIIKKTDAARRLEIAMMLRTIKPMNRPGVRQGRIGLIGSPNMKAAKVVSEYFETELGLGANISWIPPSDLESVLKDCRETGETSPMKYFMYLLDCDGGYDEGTLITAVKLFRKYLHFDRKSGKDRFDVFNCRSIRISRRDYPPLEFMAKVTKKYGFENRALYYDVEECVKRQCIYAKCKYIDFATGLYLL